MLIKNNIDEFLCAQLYYNTGTKIKNRDAVYNGITKAKHKDGRIKDEYLRPIRALKPSTTQVADTKKNIKYKKNASQQLTRVNNKF